MTIFAGNFARLSYHFSRQMTKVLLVLRHAQSAGKQSGQLDYDRSLTAEGEEIARALGKTILRQGFKLDLIASSSATRAKGTVDLVNQSIQLSDENIHFEQTLYDGLMSDWNEHIRELPNEVNQVMLVGHNPWLSMLVSSFAGTVIDLAPCELIGFEFDVDSWKEIEGPGKEIYRSNRDQ